VGNFYKQSFNNVERLHLRSRGYFENTAKMALSKAKRIQIMLGIDTAFFILELGVGSWVGSLALMADAFHMVRGLKA
jgi:Co/Zn/Cd efflux system component